MASKLLDKTNENEKNLKKLDSDIDNLTSHISGVKNEQVSMWVLLDTILDVLSLKDEGFKDEVEKLFKKNHDNKIAKMIQERDQDAKNAQ